MVRSIIHWVRPRGRKTSASNTDTQQVASSPKSCPSTKNSCIRLLKITEYDGSGTQAANPFILSGYRSRLTFLGCLRSLFLLHNETINIWSHLLGFVLFAGLFVHDLVLTIPSVTIDGIKITKTDFAVLCTLLICYQATMILSSLYHTFACHANENFSDACLSFDILGVTLGLMGTYFSGIYYAFWCEPGWRDFYLCTVGSIFLLATALQCGKYASYDKYAPIRIGLFFFWAIFGLVPTIHWMFLQKSGAVVDMLLPRIFTMYALCGAAFFFYLTKMPERLLPGLVDIIGHSHQWWHIIIFLALLFWHRTGVKFALFRLKHGCVDGDLIKEDDLNELDISLASFF